TDCYPLSLRDALPILAAVMLGMMVQSTPVSFGAVGTPIIVGVTTGLDEATISGQLEAAGSSWEAYLQLITSEVAITHAIAGVIRSEEHTSELQSRENL